MSQTIELTKALIARRSVTPADEGCQQIMTERLAAAGFAVERLSFGSVENFWARRGGTGPVFCFAGHTDVVPTGPLEEWHSDPFAAQIRDGVLYGRSGRHEERTCGDGHRQRGVRRGAPHSQGVDRISDHE